MVAKEKKMSSDLRALAEKLTDARAQRERDSTARKTQLVVSFVPFFSFPTPAPNPISLPVLLPLQLQNGNSGILFPLFAPAKKLPETM